MRWISAAIVLLWSFGAVAYFDGTGPGPGLTGNDTGGIIQWTPGIDHVYRNIAADHCAKWNRRAEITSVNRRYGGYVGFVCLYDRRYDPERAWIARWGRIW